ncbi:MAG: hypothetical protein Q9165_002421 [Trypethelium subeluteriae]
MCGFAQLPIPPLPSTLDLTDRVVIVTGGARGVGYEVSLQLARRKAKTIILGVRSIEKGNVATTRLLADEEVKRQNPEARIEVLQLDLANLESVSNFVTRVEAHVESVDLLLLNAGVNLARWRSTRDGYEM